MNLKLKLFELEIEFEKKRERERDGKGWNGMEWMEWNGYLDFFSFFFFEWLLTGYCGCGVSPSLGEGGEVIGRRRDTAGGGVEEPD